jgi:peptide/nickel transport system substrate-binding protein
MILLALGACSGETPPAEPVPSAPIGTPVDGDTLVVGFPFDPGNVNPLVAPYALSGMISVLVQPGLVNRDVGSNGLFYEPALASSWDWSDAGATLTYHLREDAKWSDGTPFTSADVQFTHELIADPVVVSNWLGNAKYIRAVEAPDPHTVVFRFDKGRNPTLQQGYTARGMVSKHELEAADRASLRGHPSARQPLASGPFVVASWEPNERIVLEPNPMAPPEWKPHIDRIVARIIPEYATRLLEFQNENLDLLDTVYPEDVPGLEADPRFRVIVQPANGMEYIGYNQTDPRFQDRRVRTALTEGLDLVKLGRDLYAIGAEDHTIPCVSTVAPQYGAWSAAGEVKPLPFDPADSRRLLEEAGWTDANGDGIRDKDGAPLRFRMLVQASDVKAKKASILVQAAWKDVGVQLDVDNVEEKTFSDRAHSKDFEAILWGFGANPKVDISQEWRSDGPYNWTSYHNPDVDALIDQAIGEVDVPTSQAAFRAAQAKIYADQPVTFMFWIDDFSAISARFQDTAYNTFTLLSHVERWWVPADRQKYPHHP